MAKFNSEELYNRLYKFAVDFQKLTVQLPNTTYNKIYIDQGIRSSGSMGANYIEAIEGISEKDFTHRLKICRKETRESVHWLCLIRDSNQLNKEVLAELKRLIAEGLEIKKIFTSSILTLEQRKISKS